MRTLCISLKIQSFAYRGESYLNLIKSINKLFKNLSKSEII